MSDCILAMKTHTDAERARRIAVSENIQAEIVNIDPSVTRRGCSVGVRLPCSKSGRLVELLERRRIPYGDLIGRGM